MKLSMNLFVLLFINCVLGANILHISPLSSRSHHIWNRVLAFGLNKKGHNVTMLTPDDEKSKLNNFHLILLEGMYDNYSEELKNIEILTEASGVTGIKTFYDFSKLGCEHVFTTHGLSTLMNYPKDFNFDLIVFDITLMQCLYPLIDRFNSPPVIAVTPFLLPPVLSHMFGNPLQTSYMPYYSMVYTDKMSFKERLINSILIYAEVLYRKYVAMPNEFAMAKKYFGDNIRSFEDIERNISILLTNTNPNFEYPVDLPPNIIPVGGLQIQPAEPLPEELQKIVNNAKEGVIVFSLGTNVRSDQLSVSKRMAILNALAKLPQTIIWKFETDNLMDLPKNVVIRKWLPQSDLLAQPNTKLLINHGGALSCQEAMYHGVPVVSIPFFMDQFTNAGRLKNKNMAAIVDYNTITTESFYNTITEVLNNPMYRNNIQNLSKRYRDRLNTPLETAVFWVEYLLRHGSAEHLGLAARDMSFFQTANLDIYAVLILGVYLIYSMMCLLFTCLKIMLKFIVKAF